MYSLRITINSSIQRFLFFNCLWSWDAVCDYGLCGVGCQRFLPLCCLAEMTAKDYDFPGWLLSRISASMLSVEMVAVKDYGLWGGGRQRFLSLCCLLEMAADA